MDTGGSPILNLITKIFLYTDFDLSYTLVTSALALFGFWGILRKCGIKGWWALVPIGRDIKLGMAAGMDAEGRLLAVMRACYILMAAAQTFTPVSEALHTSLYVFFEFMQVVIGLGIIISHELQQSFFAAE